MSYFKNQTACRPRPLIIITNTSTTIFSHTHRLYNITSSLTMWTRSSISSDMRPQQVPIFNSSEKQPSIDRHFTFIVQPCYMHSWSTISNHFRYGSKVYFSSIQINIGVLQHRPPDGHQPQSQPQWCLRNNNQNNRSIVTPCFITLPREIVCGFLGFSSLYL